MDPLLINAIILWILMALGAIIGLIWLTRLKQRDRHFEKKEITYTAILVFVLFAALGFIGLADMLTINMLYLVQGIILVAGLFFTWQLFTYFEWTDHQSFLAETLFAVLLTMIGTLAFTGIHFVVDQFLGQNKDATLDLAPAMLFFLLPYLVYRTYDYLLLVPGKRYIAWYFPEGPAPDLNIRDHNVRYLYWTLAGSYSARPDHQIVEQRSKIPMDATFGQVFKRFVEDYNKKVGQAGKSITDLRQDEAGRTIGWYFYTKLNNRGKKRYIDPMALGSDQVHEGSIVVAQRVLMEDQFAVEKPPENNTIIRIDDHSGNEPEDNDIIITEK